jgi:hypothetical protein
MFVVVRDVRFPLLCYCLLPDKKKPLSGRCLPAGSWCMSIKCQNVVIYVIKYGYAIHCAGTNLRPTFSVDAFAFFPF